MDEATIADLKQFITATVVQHTSGLDDVKADLVIVKTDLDHVKHRVDEIQLTIEESIFPYITTIDDQVQLHEKRISKLERTPA